MGIRIRSKEAETPEEGLFQSGLTASRILDTEIPGHLLLFLAPDMARDIDISTA